VAAREVGNRTGWMVAGGKNTAALFEMVIYLLVVLCLLKTNRDVSHTSPSGASTILEKYSQVLHNFYPRKFFNLHFHTNHEPFRP
jgi:hypothetical protein